MKSRFTLLLVFFFITFYSISEGTKELAPTNTDVTALYTNETFSSFNNFASSSATDLHKLFIHIANPTSEIIYFGFSQKMSTTNGIDGNLNTDPYTFTVRNPNGVIVYGPITVNATTANTNTWTLANAGPLPIVGTGGYTPFTYTPAAGAISGDYYIEFSATPTTTATGTAIKYWDITVADNGGASPTAINGRLWSYNWELRTPSISQGTDPTYTYYDRPFNGRICTYSDDGFVNDVSFNGSGFRGLSFTLAFNRFGTQSTGDIAEDRKSQNNLNQSFPQYKIFLNDPDNIVYPSGIVGSVNNSFVKNCDLQNVCIGVESNLEGQVEVLLDFDNASGAGIYDPNTADVFIVENIIPATGETAPYNRCIPWDGKDGLGNTINLSNQVPVYIFFAQGVVHFPLYDVEYLPNGLTVSTIRPNPIPGFVQYLYYDDINIPDANGTGSPTQELQGCIQPCHTWTNVNYGDQNTINTWFSSNQSVSTFVSLPTCPLDAYDDNAFTATGSSVIVDIVANDEGSYYDTTTISTTGIHQPNNGNTSINITTGEITYTPNPGFNGTDSFQYSVCSSEIPPVCDTAWVFVEVSCDPIGGENTIYGTVFDDRTNDAIRNNAESGFENIEVELYEDSNLNGAIDVGDTFISDTLTDALGNYIFLTPDSYGPVQTASSRVNKSTDDAEEDADDGDMYLNSSDLELVYEGTTEQIIGIRFENITIPPNAIIINAYIEFETDETTNITPANLTIYGQNDVNSTTFTTVDDNISDRPLTTSLVNWNSIPEWTTESEKHQTPDLSSIITEIIALPNWASGKSITMIIEGSGSRIAESYDGESANAPLLIIEYQEVTNTGSYLMQVDLTSIPTSGNLTTDNIESAVFTSAQRSDCENNFGIYYQIINATNDIGTPIIGYTGGTSVSNVLTNDSLNSVVVNPAEIVLSQISTTNAGVTLSGNSVVVASGTPAGIYVLVYQICDIYKPTNCDQASITVEVQNSPPVAINDVNETLKDSIVSGNVLTNDSDPDGELLHVTPNSGTTTNGGSFTITSNGNYIYTPPPGYTGTDTFTYQVCDNGTPALCDTATVTITVIPCIIPPDQPDQINK